MPTEDRKSGPMEIHRALGRLIDREGPQNASDAAERVADDLGVDLEDVQAVIEASTSERGGMLRKNGSKLELN